MVGYIFAYLAEVLNSHFHHMKLVLLIILFTIISSINAAIAQTLPVGLFENVEDFYRRRQLLGSPDINSSLLIRPIYISETEGGQEFQDESTMLMSGYTKSIFANKKGNIRVSLLPIVLQQQYNTHHPYGMNDGSMVQAKGYENQLSAGIFVKVGPLKVQLRPEYVYAQNKSFQMLTDAQNGGTFNRALANVVNAVDLPERFGNGDYSKLSWGQSSIRLDAGPVSIGLSNENLWWGPGIRSALLMTNNASGFKHLTLNTTRAIRTPIGSFEAQVIAGRLDQSGISPPTGALYKAKPKDWRYLSGIVATYQPKWIPNLYLGYDRSFIVSRSNMGRGFADYFPIFSALEKVNYAYVNDINIDEAAKRDQYIAFFSKYVLPESKAEIYVEFGRNDHSFDTRDAVVEPEHTRAYVVGFRKLISLPRADEYIQVGTEITQLEGTKTRDLRPALSYYIHPNVPDGYTNQGQVLGAGIGPGSNLQSLDVSWVKGLKRIGLQFERMVNNNDLYYDFVNLSADKNQLINRHWVDLSVAGKFSWNYKQFILNSQLTYIRSLNYQYQWKAGSGNYWNWDKQDVNNMQLKVGVMYSW
jgi:hypothetical protein